MVRQLLVRERLSGIEIFEDAELQELVQVKINGHE